MSETTALEAAGRKRLGFLKTWPEYMPNVLSQHGTNEANRSFSRSVNQNTVARNLAKDGQLVGYAATFQAFETEDWLGPYTEVIDNKAFNASLDANPRVVLVVNHGYGGDLPIASTKNGSLSLSVDDFGLSFVARIDATSAGSADVTARVASGAVSEASFRARLRGGHWNDDATVFRMTELDLNYGDVSVVTYGANPAAFVTVATPPSVETQPDNHTDLESLIGRL